MKLYIPKTKNILILYFIILIVVPCIFLLSIFYNTIFSSLEKQTQKAHLEVVNQANLSLQNQITQIYTSINKLSCSNSLQNILKSNKLDATGSDLYLTYKDIDQIFNAYSIDMNNFYGLVIETNNGDTYFNTRRSFVLDNPSKEIWKQKTSLLNGEIYWVTDQKDSNGENLLIFCKQIFDNTIFKDLGFIYLAFKSSLISSSINNYFSPDCSTYILTASNHCVFESNIPFKKLTIELFPDTSSKSITSFIYENQEYIALFSNLNSYNLRLLTLYPSNIYTTELNHIRQLFFMMLILVLICFLVFILSLYKCFINPLKNLSALFAEGSLQSSISSMSNLHTYEFKNIGYGIISLIQTNTKDTQQIIKLTHDKNKILLDKIQAQVNPHFLYNTLTSIKYLALQSRTQDISSLSTSLVKLLRACVNRDGDFITIEEELKNLQYYISIQNIFYDKISFYFETQDMLNQYFIPNFILQPLVENSIFHGIDPSDPTSKIVVRNKLSNHTILFEIEDNGRGFNLDTLENFNSSFSTQSSASFSNLGLKNIDTRIKLLCGETYGLTIFSTPDTKTIIQIGLPIKSYYEVNNYDKSSTC